MHLVFNDDFKWWFYFCSWTISFHFISFHSVSFIIGCLFFCLQNLEFNYKRGFHSSHSIYVWWFFFRLLMLMIVLKLIIFLRASCSFYGSCFAHESEIKFFFIVHLARIWVWFWVSGVHVWMLMCYRVRRTMCDDVICWCYPLML